MSWKPVAGIALDVLPLFFVKKAVLLDTDDLISSPADLWYAPRLLFYYAVSSLVTVLAAASVL